MQAPPQFIVPFKILFKRLEGSVPGYRTGTVSIITADGIVIAGKTVMPYEKQAPILIASLPLRMYLVAYLVMEYGMRRDAYDMIPWTNVVRVASDPKRREICIMYDAPNHKGIVKRFSLTFKVDPTMFEPFIAAFGANGVDVQPAKLRPWSSPPALIFLIGVLIIILVIAGIALTSPSKPGP